MLHGEALGLLLGAVALGAVHGVEPGHGWPVAASYALDQSNKWLSGFAASFLLGVGHLISSIAMVAVFFYAKSYFSLTQVNEPIELLPGFTIGGPVSLVAGVLLILLGLREYYGGGHSHGHDDDGESHEHDAQSHQHDDHHDHSLDVHEHGQSHQHDHHDHDGHGHDLGHGHDHGHSHAHDEHDHDDEGLWARIKGAIPFVGGHSHDHGDLDEAAERGLYGIAWFAFLLGFAHEEEFEIIALCAGSTHCLELMGAYALTVIVGIVGLTMLLVAGYEHSQERVERFTPYLPAFSAVVLIVMGLGFVAGVF